jgi:hypothetical protein
MVERRPARLVMRVRVVSSLVGYCVDSEEENSIL